MIRKRYSCLKTFGILGILILLYLQIFTDQDGLGEVKGANNSPPDKSRLGRVPQEQGEYGKLGGPDSSTPSPDAAKEDRSEPEGNGAGGAEGDQEGKEADGDQEGKGEGDKKAPESLAGEREHGLPNTTNVRENTLVESDKIAEILDNIQKNNEAERVQNLDLFGPLSSIEVVITIQVHDRIEYLRHLIASLSAVRGIQKALLIFSHDVWDEDINTLISSVDFALVTQIFYPFSLQTHPSSFPGQSEQDCPRDAKPKQKTPLTCYNKDWPDLYGHYREAKFTQTKHHWWWKANQIFYKLKATQAFNGTVLFLEEDHYVTEDFIQVLHMMEAENNKLEHPAKIVCMGTYLKKFNYKLNSKQLELTQWMSSKHNMGMGLTRASWNKITQCKNHFCQYDDYNWDWSLLHVSHNCLKEKLQVLLVKGPRVFHIGECGVHHRKKDCSSSLVMDKVTYIIKSARQYFFPDRLSVSRTTMRKKLKLKKGNGGWGDKRDHALCLNMSLTLDTNL